MEQRHERSRQPGRTAAKPPDRDRAVDLLIVLAGTIAWLWWSGMAEEILAYSGDISYLTVQHLELVAWAGGLAILVAVPVGIVLSGPPSASFRRR